MSAATGPSTANTPKPPTSAPGSSAPRNLAYWGNLLRSAGAGELSNTPFPDGQFTDIEGEQYSSTRYHFTLTWSPWEGGAFRQVEISIYSRPDAMRVYNQVRAGCLQESMWGISEPEGWNEWPRGYPTGKDKDEDVMICGRTDLGLKVAWVQKGDEGRVVVVKMESLAGHRILKEYSDGVVKAVRLALKQ